MANEQWITCQEFVEMVTDYLENVLLPEVRQRFEEHAEKCPGCDTYLNQIRQTISMLHQVVEEPVSTDTQQKLLQVFAQWQQTRKQNDQTKNTE